jgi:hypothetical protein
VLSKKKILILISNNIVNYYYALYLKKKLLKNNFSYVDIFRYDLRDDFLKVIKKKIFKIGFLRTIDQLICKFLDYFILQFIFKLKIKKKIFFKYGNHSNHNLLPKFQLNKKKIRNYDLILCFSVGKIDDKYTNNRNYNFINFHPGYLPAYAGIGNFYSILNKDNNFGFSIHYMSSKIDQGQVIIKKKININNKRSIYYINFISTIKAINSFIYLLKNKKIKKNKARPNKNSNIVYYSWPGILDYIKYFKYV